MANYSVILSNVGSCADRYVPQGYADPFELSELFARVSQIPQVTGVELVGTWHVRDNNVKELKKYLSEHQLRLASIIPDHFGEAKWKYGSFSSRDPLIRRQAVEHAKEMMDAAA